MSRLFRPVLVGVIGAVAIAIARDNPTQGPLIVAAAAALAVACVVMSERGAALAALGIGAAGAFAAPAGLGPLLVASGAVLACDVAAVDRRLIAWRDVLEATIALPALAGLAGTVAAQPSMRAVALGATTAAVVIGSAWRGAPGHPAPTGLSIEPGLGLLAGFVIAFAPDRVTAFGELPMPTVQAARSLAAGIAVFALVLLIGMMQAERAARARPVRRSLAVHRRP